MTLIITSEGLRPCAGGKDSFPHFLPSSSLPQLPLSPNLVEEIGHILIAAQPPIDDSILTKNLDILSHVFFLLIGKLVLKREREAESPGQGGEKIQQKKPKKRIYEKERDMSPNKRKRPGSKKLAASGILLNMNKRGSHFKKKFCTRRKQNQLTRPREKG